MPRRNLVVAYVLLVGLPILMLLLIVQAGQGLVPPATQAALDAAPGAGAPAPLNLVKLVLQIAVILVVSRGVGLLFRKIRQPQVVGEVFAGILLGPSLLGWLAPVVSQNLFPAASLGYLNALSQIGLIFFLFLVGLSLNPKELHQEGHAAVLTSHASIVTPFFLGGALGLFLYPRLATNSVGFTSFVLFMGSAMSITAFPVLARILAERNLLQSRMGTLSIACAAVDDITGWCILAFVVMTVRAGKTSFPLGLTVGGALVFVFAMVFAIKPLLRRFERYFHKSGRLTEGSISLMIALALASALVTEWLGIHALFGAFFLGAVMPKGHEFVQAVLSRLESLTVVVLLPLFFAFSGLRTRIGMVQGGLWLYVIAIIAVAVAGKFGGSTLAARMAGISWRDAASLGVLMNTRGLMELIALNIGLEIGVITPTLFTMLVMMALVTTFMTSPLLEKIYPAKLMVVDAPRASAQVA